MTTWLSGFQYRKSHVVSAQAGAGTFYQKQITVHYGAGVDGDDDVYCTVGGVAHCKTDFGDIRFTDNDGETELDYWMESKVDSNNAVFWVEVKDDLTTNPVTIYVYYGKADATYPFGADQTEMDATFLFADHFYGSSLDLTKWAGDTGYASVSGSKLTFVGEAGVWKKIYTTTLGTQFVLRQKSRFQGRTTNKGADIGLRHTTTTDIVQIEYFAAINRIRCYKAGAYTFLDSNADTTERIYDVLWRSAQADFVKDGTAMTNSPITTNVPIVTLPIMFEAVGGAGYGVECDWVFARKYVSPEPAHSTWGTEESGSPADPTNLSGACVGSTRIDLAWTDNATNETDYYVERNDGGWHVIASLPADSNGYSDTTVNCGGAGYLYRVRCYNSASGYYSNYVTLGASVTCALQDPTGITAMPLAVFPLFAIRLNWNDVCSCETSVRVERDDGGWHEIGFAAAGSTQFDDYTITCGVAYLYRIRNYDSVSGLYSGYNTLAAPTYGLLTGAEPTSLTATAISGTQIDLAWTEVCPCETNVLVERNEDGGAYHQIANLPPNSNSYPDTPVTCDINYSYRVRVFDSVSGNYSGYTTLGSPILIPCPVSPVSGGGKPSKAKKFKLVDYFSHYEDYGTIRAAIRKLLLQETIPITASIKKTFEETVGIRAKVAEAFEETMPITASIMKSFQETVQTKGNIIQKFEETIEVSADIMRTVFQETMAKVKGIVVPIRKKLEELRRRIEEITDDLEGMDEEELREELRRRQEEDGEN